MATPSLPRFIGLEARNHYLQYQAKEGQSHRRVMLMSTRVASDEAFTKFEVVPTSDRNMVHIRTCYNNKFLRLESDRGGNYWLVATADEPEEDCAKWSCTLFRCVYNNNRLGLFHQARNAQRPVLTVQSTLAVTNSTSPMYFGVIDLQTLAILPRHVSFIGDNNLYLSSIYIRLRNRLQFLSSSRFDPTVHNLASTLSNGDVQLRSSTFGGQLWRKSNPEWIWCDTTNTNDPDTVFRPIRLDNQGKTIALLNVRANKYCMRWIRAGQPRLIDTLTASATHIVPQAVMTVQEAIRDREIYDIQYRIAEARVYNVGPWHRVVPETADNFSYTETSSTTLGYSYEKVTQETFSSSHSWKVSSSAKIRVKIIPILVQGIIKFNAHYEGNVTWSELREEREIVSTSVQVPIPPRTRAVVTMVVGRGSIDVPYSYKQRDVLLDGTHEIRTFEDGIFTGLNTEVFHFDIREERLPDDNNSSPLGEADEEMVARHYLLRPESAPKAALLPSKEEEPVEEEAEARAVVPSKL